MKVSLIFFLLSLSVLVFSQTNDIDRICLNTYVPSKLNFSIEVKTQLENKLSQIATNYGLGGNQSNPRFVITANVSVISKDIIAGPPTMVAQNIDVTFFIGDGIDNVLFTSLNISLMGVGTNENKAFIEALKNIKTKTNEIQKFIDDGKNKIINYYASKCDFILKNAESLVNQGKYDDAIYELFMVPPVCKDCYLKCKDKLGIYFQQKIDADCVQKLSLAKSNWMSNQNYSGAEQAGKILITIHPASSCISQVNQLINTIREKIRADEQAAWEFRIKQYEDAIVRENELIKYAREDASREFELDKLRTESFRQIAVEFAKNQPKYVNYNYYYDRIYWW